MKAGVGYSDRKDSFLSGQTVAEVAMKTGGIERPSLALAFCGGKVDAARFLGGLQSVLGIDVPIIGGSAIGIITNDNLSYEGYPAGVAVLELDGLKFAVSFAHELDKDEAEAGERLGEAFRKEMEARLLLIFYDSIKHSPTATTPPVLNASPPLLRGIEGKLWEVPVIGAGLVADYNFGPSQQFCGSRVCSQSVAGVLFQGDFHYYHQIMHGCTPKDGVYHTITRMEGPVIYEIDGRPIVEMIDDMYGNRDWQNQCPVKRLTIGVDCGEKYGEHSEEEYVNRLIAGVVPGGNGIVIFEPDLGPGTEILFMLRDTQAMMESVMKNTSELMARIRGEGKRPAFGLYIDCAGRTASHSEILDEEALAVSRVFGQAHVPLLGFYSGVEIAPLLGKSRGLDWTGVLLVFAEEE